MLIPRSVGDFTGEPSHAITHPVLATVAKRQLDHLSYKSHKSLSSKMVSTLVLLLYI